MQFLRADSAFRCLFDFSPEDGNKSGFRSVFCIIKQKTEAISPHLRSDSARVRSLVESYDICSEQSGTRACSLRLCQFPVLIVILPVLHTQPSFTSGAGTVGPRLANLPNGLGFAQPQIIHQGHNPLELSRNYIECSERRLTGP
jgi:hypothetical protein